MPEKAPEELIDTLWNVNYFEIIQLQYARLELIDTLWNVNYTCQCHLLQAGIWN